MPGKWLRRPLATTSVVFVHGILSSGETCWRHDNGTYWPELLEGESALESLGIYVFTYQTGIFSGDYRLSDIVDDAKETMSLDGVLDSDQIIFVCHSMGGIIVRKFLVERAADLISKRKKIGLFLIASPSLGASYANWLSLIAQMLGHSQATALRFATDWLMDLDKEFTNLKESRTLTIVGKEIIEDKFIVLPGLVRSKVVAPFSGAKYFGEQYKVPKSDHFTIAKPENSNAIQHRLLTKFVTSLLDSQEQSSLPPSSVSSPQQSRTATPSPFVSLHLLRQSVEVLDFAPEIAIIRFTITNITSGMLKLTELVVRVMRKKASRSFKLPGVGARCLEYKLYADISTQEAVDLLASTEHQFILKPEESEAFSLSLRGAQGYDYEIILLASVESVLDGSGATVSSKQVSIRYPISTMKGLQRWKE